MTPQEIVALNPCSLGSPARTSGRPASSTSPRSRSATMHAKCGEDHDESLASKPRDEIVFAAQCLCLRQSSPETSQRRPNAHLRRSHQLLSPPAAFRFEVSQSPCLPSLLTASLNALNRSWIDTFTKLDG